MSAREAVVAVLDEHILFGYGRCSCGVEFTRYGRYSKDHRRHVADALASTLSPTSPAPVPSPTADEHDDRPGLAPGRSASQT